jgi:hypothetical protein
MKKYKITRAKNLAGIFYDEIKFTLTLEQLKSLVWFNWEYSLNTYRVY